MVLPVHGSLIASYSNCANGKQFGGAAVVVSCKQSLPSLTGEGARNGPLIRLRPAAIPPERLRQQARGLDIRGESLPRFGGGFLSRVKINVLAAGKPIIRAGLVREHWPKNIVGTPGLPPVRRGYFRAIAETFARGDVKRRSLSPRLGVPLRLRRRSVGGLVGAISWCVVNTRPLSHAGHYQRVEGALLDVRPQFAK